MILLKLLLLFFTTSTLAVYDDQFGENDWIRETIGSINFGKFNQQYKPSQYFISVSNNQNTLSAIELQNGNLLWRKTFTEKILAFDFYKVNTGSSSSSKSFTNADSIFVVKEDKIMIFKADSGHVMNENSVDLEGFQLDSQFDAEHWVFKKSGNDQIFTSIQWDNKQKHSLKTVKINENYSGNDGILLGKQNILLDGEVIFSNSECTLQKISNSRFFTYCNENSLTVYENNAEKIIATFPIVQPLNVDSFEPDNVSNGKYFYAISTDNNEIWKFNADTGEMSKNANLRGLISFFHQSEQHLYLYIKSVPRNSMHSAGLKLITLSKNNLQEVTLSGINAPKVVNDNVNFIAVNEFISKHSNDKNVNSRILVQNKFNKEINYNGRWNRDDGLADVTSSIVVDLQDAESSSHAHEAKEVKTSFFGRIVSDFIALYDMLYAKIEITLLYLYNKEPFNVWEQFPEDFANAGYDTSKIAASAFGVRKLIITHSIGSNTIYVIDSKNGDIYSKKVLPGIEEASKVILLNKDMEIFVVATDKNNLLIRLISFDATSEGDGDFINHSYEKHLPFDIKVTAVLDDFVLFENGLTFDLGEKSEEDEIQEEDQIYFHKFDENSQAIEGFLFDKSNKRQISLWSLDLEKGHKLVSIGKAGATTTNAIGRALQDRSIQYKYLNPHLITMVTSIENQLNIYILDGITGNIVYIQQQHNAAEPVQVAQIDNWVTYSYWDSKRRRYNIESVEFYKGRAHTFSQMTEHSQGTFSSAETNVGGVDITILKQGFILPFEPSILKTTFTNKGITQRALLIPNSATGKLVQVPHVMLDARRIPKMYTRDEKGNYVVDSKLDDSKELPGSYFPEIFLSPDTLVSTNRTITGVNNVAVAPAKLESTCVAFAYGGLDVYFINNLAPSKHFDRLDGFGKTKLGLLCSCVGLLILTLFLKNRTEWDQINRAWQ